MRQGHLQHPSSRYACCTPGVLDLCVRAVAAEARLDDVIPEWSSREVALVARDALEALELTENLGHRLTDREIHMGDWALTVLAEVRFLASQKYRERKRLAHARQALDLALAAIEDAAASSDRSPVLWYEDMFADAAHALVRRGDRTGLVRQIECVAEALRQPGGGNVRGTVRDLALFHLALAEHRAGLSLLAGLQRDDPSDPWTYNVIAMRFADFGLPTLARLAGERGLELVRRDGDPEHLTEQLTGFIRETGSSVDRSDAPKDAVEELRDALHVDFDEVLPVSPAEMAVRLVPAVATARVKDLPPAPAEDALSRTAHSLRGLLKAASRPAVPLYPAGPAGPPTPLAPQAGRRKIGRNDPCPCGSGKKLKKCCLK